jgi:DNA polymerase III epsilon subunit-like protein
MSWLGQNGASRDDFYALADAYKKMYGQEQLDEKKELPDFIQKKVDEKKGKKDDDKKDDKKEDKKPAFLKKEEFEAWLDGWKKVLTCLSSPLKKFMTSGLPKFFKKSRMERVKSSSLKMNMMYPMPMVV